MPYWRIIFILKLEKQRKTIVVKISKLSKVASEVIIQLIFLFIVRCCYVSSQVHPIPPPRGSRFVSPSPLWFVSFRCVGSVEFLYIWVCPPACSANWDKLDHLSITLTTFAKFNSLTEPSNYRSSQSSNNDGFALHLSMTSTAVSIPQHLHQTLVTPK